MKKEVITFGCRLNSYESEVIRGHLDACAGDTVVFNTCAVTKEAERQAGQAIRRYRRENPNSKIIVTGCAAQISPQKYAEMEAVDKVISNTEKMKKESFSDDTEKVLVNDIMSVKETASHLVSGLEGRSRAFIQVQNGCNHRCTFCIIPYGRGNSRSVPMGEIVEQTKILIKSGYNEIVLTGVDITDYGLDLPAKPTLGAMIKRLLKNVPQLKRLRLSSIDVAEIDDDLRDLIENEPRLMPHLHLSLQSGDNMILKRMKRRHSREQVIEFCRWARSVRPNVAFGADIIAGFPTESEEMFQNSLNIVQEAGLVHLHVFPYSERDGTPAANIPLAKQVPVSVRKERAKLLRMAGEKNLRAFLKTRIGKSENLIIEKNNLGRSEHFALVELKETHPIGSIVPVTISAENGEHLLAA